MTEHDITQIAVGGHRTGIIGLKPVLEAVARELAGRPETEIRAALMERLGKSNYIVASARAAYEAAFFREYKKFIGDPMPVNSTGPVRIKVLGQGCPSCVKLEQDVMSVLAELGLAADLDHVRDIHQIAAYGVMGSRPSWSMAWSRPPERFRLRPSLRSRFEEMMRKLTRQYFCICGGCVPAATVGCR